jgi:hypothetical protein
MPFTVFFVLGIELWHLRVRVDRLLGEANIVGSVAARNVLLGTGGGHVETGAHSPEPGPTHFRK